jgi:hypothetical protein
MPVPVVLFVYNRPLHTRKTIEALQRNDLADETSLYVFADGPRYDADCAAVDATRESVRGVSGFKHVEIIERDQNLGLAHSVIRGVSEVIAQHGEVIVVEDDLISSPGFLQFMNQALAHYRDEAQVFSVSGFSFPVEKPIGYQYDAYCTYRSMSWSWGTWLNRWQQADWQVSDFASFYGNRRLRKAFNRGGEDLSDLLLLQKKGRIDSWSIIWDYTHYKHDAFCLCPTVSKIVNIGFDGSGVHGVDEHIHQHMLQQESTAHFALPPPAIEPHYTDAIAGLHRYGRIQRIKALIKRYLPG